MSVIPDWVKKYKTKGVEIRVSGNDVCNVYGACKEDKICLIRKEYPIFHWKKPIK